MAMPTYVVSGVAIDSTGSGTVPLPSTLQIQTDDVLILAIETANEPISITNQAGGTWTEAGSSPQGTGTAGGSTSTRLTVFWSRYNGTQTAPTVSDSGNHQIGRITAWRGCKTSGSPINVTSGAVDATVDTFGSLPGATTTANNCLILLIASAQDDAATYDTASNGDLAAITARSATAGTAGNDGYVGVFSGEKANAGTYGTTSLVTAANTSKGMISIALEGTASGFSGDGGPTVPKPSIAATAALVFAGTAALSVPQSSIAASGGWTEPVTGSAALTVPQSTIAASGQVIFTGTGALTVPVPSVSSTATFIANAGSATIAVPTSSIAASGLETFTGTSGIVVPVSVVASAGIETFTATAALTANAQVSGIGNNSGGPAIAGGAAINVPSLAVASSGAQAFVGAGAVSVPAVLSVAGSGTERFVASATVSVPMAAITGAGTEAFPGTASVTVPRPAVVAVGFGAGSGSIAVPQAAIAGTGTVVGFVGTASITIPRPVIVGLPGGTLPFRAMAVHYALIDLHAAHSDTAVLGLRHAAVNSLTAAPVDAFVQASVMDSYTCDDATTTVDNNHGTCDDAPMRYIGVG